MATIPQPRDPLGRSFGELLKGYRQERGLTQEDLAERARLSVRGISDLERGLKARPYQATVQVLAAALQLSPGERAAFEAAARQPAAGLPEALPPLRSLESVPHNLPVQLTSFVGREREMAAVARLLGQTRLLTLTGVGGTGKTRLALQVVADRLAEYPQGVWFVELASLGDPALVPGAVASTLGITEDPSRPPLATLTAALRPKRVLIVLDNCEHLIGTCAQLVDALLHACPHVQILATSREVLGIAGEVSWPVPSLDVPQDQLLGADIARCSAVRLFAERAQAVQPQFTLTEQNMAVVGQVCRRLDGIPLALELAAARLRALSVEQLAVRLDQRFRLLTGGSRTALPRQQTLQAAVDWSYGLLSPAEQRVFIRLSVFAGGFTLEAAEAVCAGGAIAPEDVLDLLVRLVEKSLVMAETGVGEEARYRLLETLRQYGRESMIDGPEATALRDRYAAYYLALTERAESELHGPGQRQWLDRLEQEHDNLRAVLGWCLEQATPGMGDDTAVALETGARMASALLWFWVYRDHRREAREWLDRVLSAGGPGPALRAQVLRGAGWLAWDAQDLTHARALLEQSIALYQDLGDKAERAFALSLLAPVVWQEGKDEQAITLSLESIALARESGARWYLAWALCQSAFGVTMMGRPSAELRASARAAGEEGLRIFQELGDTLGTVWAHMFRGLLALREGDHSQAQAAFRATLAGTRAVGWRGGRASPLCGLGDVAREQGDLAAAVGFYEEGLTLYRDGSTDRDLMAGVLCRLGEIALDRGDWSGAHTYAVESIVVARDVGQVAVPQGAAALDLLGSLAAARNESRRALRLAGAAAAVREQAHLSLAPSDQAALARRLNPARAALGEDEAEAAFAEGQAMTLEQAVAYSLQEPAAVAGRAQETGEPGELP